MPYIADVAIGKRPHLNIFGNDYATRDGTGERDYIHVVDLAKAHVAAISKTLEDTAEVFNVGTGSGTTVLELAEEFRLASGRELDLKLLSDVQGMWLLLSLPLIRLLISLAGLQPITSKTCVMMLGDGSLKILTDMTMNIDVYHYGHLA